MKRRSLKKRLQSGAESGCASPPVPTTNGENAKEANTKHPAETPDFPEGHEDPEQSAELERQQDA